MINDLKSQLLLEILTRKVHIEATILLQNIGAQWLIMTCDLSYLKKCFEEGSTICV